MKIIVVTHKAVTHSISNPYQYIAVGKNKSSIDVEWKDDLGINISSKNANYCELTALYWLWKNQIDNFNIVGLCHYRRFFGRNFLDVLRNKPISSKKIEHIMKDFEIILPRPFRWKKTVAEMYYVNGDGRKADLDITKAVMSEIYPNYVDSFDKVIHAHEAAYCNMFVMSSELVSEYCKWLFDILFEVERRVDLSGYTIQEARVFGYLSEILLNVWACEKKLKIKYVPMIKTEESLYRKSIDQVKYYIKKVNG